MKTILGILFLAMVGCGGSSAGVGVDALSIDDAGSSTTDPPDARAAAPDDDASPRGKSDAGSVGHADPPDAGSVAVGTDDAGPSVVDAGSAPAPDDGGYKDDGKSPFYGEALPSICWSDGGPTMPECGGPPTVLHCELDGVAYSQQCGSGPDTGGYIAYWSTAVAGSAINACTPTMSPAHGCPIGDSCQVYRSTGPVVDAFGALSTDTGTVTGCN